MNTNDFSIRHIGVGQHDADEMLRTIGVKTLDELINQTLPSNIRLDKPLDLPEPMTERSLLSHISDLASKNEVYTSYIGQAGTIPYSLPSSSVMYWRTPSGTHPILPIKQRSLRVALKRSSTSSRSSRT